MREKKIGNSREDLRIHNLSLVLSLIHRSKDVSRSDLAAQTGLNRSTISDLVSELTTLGLTVETEKTQASGVGRPSHIVSSSNRVVAIAIEISNYSVRAAIVGLAGVVYERRRVLTGLLPDPEFVISKIVELVSELKSTMSKDNLIAGIGISIPGQVNQKDGVVRQVTALGWGEVAIAERVSKATGLPVKLGNDGTISCAAERDFGAGRSFNEIVYIFGGSGGIGGGVVVGGQILRGASGFAGELGHMRISDSKVEDNAGLPGTVEALLRREDLLDALHVDDVDDDELSRLVSRSNSVRVKKLVDRQIDLLGAAIANFVNIFNPEIVLLAGFLSALFDADDYRLLARARAGGLAGARERVIIRKAELGTNLVLVGAAELAFAELLANPAGASLFSPRKKK